MSILQLAILTIFAVIIGQWKKARLLGLLGTSAFVLYWLQPPQAMVNMTFWFPTATLAVTVLAWSLTASAEARSWKRNWQAALVLTGVILLVDMNRYFQIEQVFITMTPRLQWAAAAVAIVAALVLLMPLLGKFQHLYYAIAASGLVALLALIKTPSALERLIGVVSTLRGNEAMELVPLSWLGFSYVSFRLLHTILDRKAGRFPSVPLAEYVNYVIFFPSFTAGPIDRFEHFSNELNSPALLDRQGWMDAGERIFAGMFKKFVLADALAWIALNDEFARQLQTSGWMWMFLYAYSLRIFFDFSGYTDIAIGLGRLMGVRLPENFAAPYLKPNLTQFWNSWHMTLTQWFRAYYFNPLTRAIRSSKLPLPQPLIVFVAQVSTMVLIGLWHGVSASFLLWGLWHGIGLFIQNRWSDFAQTRMSALAQFGVGQSVVKYAGIFVTFNFVSLGWLFFILPTPALAWQAALKLFGIA